MTSLPINYSWHTAPKGFATYENEALRHCSILALEFTSDGKHLSTGYCWLGALMGSKLRSPEVSGLTG